MIFRTIINKNSIITLIKNSKTLPQLNQIHAQIILNNFSNHLITSTKLTHKLFDFQATNQAKNLFKSLTKTNPPDLFLYNVLIRGLSQNGCPLDSLLAYLELRERTLLEPDNFTYLFVVSAVSALGCEKVGVLIHGHALISGYAKDCYAGSGLVDMYVNLGKIEDAYKVFDGIAEPDTVAWNTMISSLVKISFFHECCVVFRDMVRKGGRFDSTTVAVVLSAVAGLKDLRKGVMIQCVGIKVGCDLHDYVLTGLVNVYSKCGDILSAELLFGLIKKPDLVSCNAMIAGFSLSGDIKSAIRLFKELVCSRGRVNASTVVGLIPVSCPFRHLDLLRSIHCFCLKSGMLLDPSISTALISVYCRLNEIELGKRLFDESPEKGVAAWNAMISGYAQNGLTEPAISLFKEMQRLDIHPNSVTVTSILSACAQLGALSLGKWVHDLIKKGSFDWNIYVSTALIDMYAKCGNIAEARELFNTMEEKNVVTWNAMISAYGLHGLGHEALTLFEEMLNSKVTPSGVTLLSILYACSHSGLVEEGQKLYYFMVNDHGFTPSAEHYACMVDLLGRAGQLKKAVEFLNSMPVSPGTAEWGALLGACMIHKNTDLARLASDKLFELDPGSVGHYVLLSNIYSVDRNYSQAASVRQTVKKQNLAKTPGCTLIEVDGQPHVFTSSDQSHPNAAAIYDKLEEIMGKMKDVGFQIETTTALHDVEDEEKELMVTVHSEKLAIAYGLITSEPGTEIRIIKNLRVCLDCHNFTKFVSKITERVITVRDANRFHHFTDGVCSCKDYW
ncbi:hypothetical protein LIER_18844 [Lithospermum erythrorhizon]|uniref:DYW domain-containing protein n=1 Tax=Lithospermum erythrorhizon TaxID=34254 RepID=A0AAV3QGJ0_LITER